MQRLDTDAKTNLYVDKIIEYIVLCVIYNVLKHM